MAVVQELFNTSIMFENDPGFNVVYLKFPNGSINLSVEPKEELGFKFPDRKEEDGEGERD